MKSENLNKPIEEKTISIAYDEDTDCFEIDIQILGFAVEDLPTSIKLNGITYWNEDGI